MLTNDGEIRKSRDSRHTTSATMTQLKDIRKKLPLRVLSEEDWQHWITKGYVVVPNAVPETQITRLVKLLWEFLEMDPNDQTTWYQTEWHDHSPKNLNKLGMVEIY